MRILAPEEKVPLSLGSRTADAIRASINRLVKTAREHKQNYINYRHGEMTTVEKLLVSAWEKMSAPSKQKAKEIEAQAVRDWNITGHQEFLIMTECWRRISEVRKDLQRNHRAAVRAGQVTIANLADIIRDTIPGATDVTMTLEGERIGARVYIPQPQLWEVKGVFMQPDPVVATFSITDTSNGAFAVTYALRVDGPEYRYSRPILQTSAFGIPGDSWNTVFKSAAKVIQTTIANIPGNYPEAVVHNLCGATANMDTGNVPVEIRRPSDVYGGGRLVLVYRRSPQTDPDSHRLYTPLEKATLVRTSYIVHGGRSHRHMSSNTALIQIAMIAVHPERTITREKALEYARDIMAAFLSPHMDRVAYIDRLIEDHHIDAQYGEEVVNFLYEIVDQSTPNPSVAETDDQ